MCGLAGVFGSFCPERTRESVEKMLDIQTHRGPDSVGAWCGSVNGVNIGLGLRRLKILDLSDAANQPMISEDGRFVLVFNGEIYNYLELRNELETHGTTFRTNGDTEVLLQALILWGEAALARLNGMWAVVLLDRVKGKVLLSRDRFGIKPLYTYSDKRGFFVSSEIKAILGVTGRKFKVKANVAELYLNQHLLCTGAATFFAGIEEFPAGHFAICSVDDLVVKDLNSKRYWTIPTTCPTLSESDLIEAVRETFLDSVKLRLRSDVPVGILLSGGIDSSAIAAIVHNIDTSRDNIRFISAVGDYGTNDEQPFIDMMANHLDRRVDKVILDYPSSKALDMISEATWLNDEPIGSFSTVAHYLLMKRAKELGVTVLLSGQGADESLCGYKKYVGFYLQEMISAGHLRAAAQALAMFMRTGTVVSQFSYREAKRYFPQWLRLSEIDVRGPALRDVGGRIDVGLNGDGVIGRQVMDIERLSVPALVHYEDRMSMAAAREIRLPFLDYRLVNLLVPLPIEFKLRSGWTKWIFRKAMEPLLPHAIAWRKDKQNFIVPQNNWLRSELRDDMAKLLRSEWVTERLGIIDRNKFRMRYEMYLRQPVSGGRLALKDIFAPLSLELWARRFESYLSA